MRLLVHEKRNFLLNNPKKRNKYNGSSKSKIAFSSAKINNGMANITEGRCQKGRYFCINRMDAPLNYWQNVPEYRGYRSWQVFEV